MKDDLKNKSNNKLNPKKLDRIVLDSESVEVIKSIMSQAESQLGGLINISPKLIGNFIIKNRSTLLSIDELEALRAENQDIVKILALAMADAKIARQIGSEFDFNKLIKNIQTPGVNLNMTPKKTRGRKKKINTIAATNTENKSAPINHNQSGTLNNEDSKLQKQVTIIDNIQTQVVATFS